MGKAFGILLIAIAIWVGLEIYTEGLDHAMGGALAFLEDGRKDEPARGSALERTRAAAEAAHQRDEERLAHMPDE